MPEYLAPGVFVEEVSFRAKSIEGVATTTTGFVGACRYGPIDLEPDIITSLVEFERIHGGKARLDFADTGAADNYLWNAVRAFFEEGGKRCYVARAFNRGADPAQEQAVLDAASSRLASSWPPANVRIRARFPGAAGDGQVRLQLALSQNRFSISAGTARLSASADHDVVVLSGLAVAADDGLYALSRDALAGTWTFDNGLAAGANRSFELQALPATVAVRTLTATLFFDPADSGLPVFAVSGLALDRRHTSNGEPDSIFDYLAQTPASQSRARSLPIIVWQLDAAAAAQGDADAQGQLADAITALGLAEADEAAEQAVVDPLAQDVLDAEAGLAGADPNDAAAVAAAQLILTQAQAALLPAQALLAAAQAAAAAALTARNAAQTVADAAAAALAAVTANPTGLPGIEFARSWVTPAAAPDRVSRNRLLGRREDASAIVPFDPLILDVRYMLSGGSDGDRPDAADYAGGEDPATNQRWGLRALEAQEDISIIAAPGSTATGGAAAQAITLALIAHAERMKYCIAVLDSVMGDSIADVRAWKAQFDSSHAAFYYPWVRIMDPLTGVENIYPPSGFVAGIYARNDVDRAVWKAPANEVVRLAIGFEKQISKAQQEVLNPEGVNCFRFFEGRGYRLWGARTASSDPEWKYVNLRRYFAYLERSIDKGTQWAVFEPNGERLWANVRSTIGDFLLNEWQNGALLGDKPERAFFVKCDRSTMSQNDLDNGRLVCLVGLAPLRPAEFVIFRIGQWTADRRI
jgi:uncharacterized protein